MQGILFQYDLKPTTWVYLSSLMTIGIYFKFRRFWSLRNLDLVGLIAFSPGLLLVYHGLQRQLDVWERFEVQWLWFLFADEGLAWRWLGELAAAERFGQWLEQFGYIWLFGVGAFFLIRLLLDPIVVRRPLLEPNLSAGGLTFMGAALLVFLMSNVLNPNAPRRLEHVLAQQAGPAPEARAPAPAGLSAGSADTAIGPGRPDQPARRGPRLMPAAASRTVVILGHLALVAGMVLVGLKHFGNIQTGVAVASLYLLLPYAAQMTARVDHVVPAALLVWAVEEYRRPVVAGVLIGLAAGLIFYPLFLLPLWCGFYWRRGLVRFLIGASAAVVAASTLLAFGGGLGWLAAQWQQMVSWTGPSSEYLAGFWDPDYHQPVFRIPVIAAFVALSAGLALWPAQKNLGTLLSCSAAVMLATQFWHPYHGGIHMAWHLPLLLLTVFRPNLEDRVALSAVREGWTWRRKAGPGR